MVARKGVEGWTGRAQRIFRVVKVTYVILKWWISAIILLSKPTECTTRRTDPKVNYGLWVIMMYQCRFISCNQCTPLMRDADSVEGYACVGQGVYGKTLYLSLNFVVKSKTSPKYKVLGGKKSHLKKCLKMVNYTGFSWLVWGNVEICPQWFGLLSNHQVMSLNV